MIVTVVGTSSRFISSSISCGIEQKLIRRGMADDTYTMIIIEKGNWLLCLLGCTSENKKTFLLQYNCNCGHLI